MNKRLERTLLIAIVAIALIARFRGLTAIEHNVDHAYPIWQALTTLERLDFPLAGQGTSVLFANPPLTGYLYLPVVALTRSMLGVYVFVIALNTLGVYFTYRAVKAVTHAAPALIAAALMAVNPWAIEYSRTSWVQSLLPFFVPAIAALIWPILLNQARRPARQTLLAFVLITLFAHTYLLAFFVLLPVGILLVLFRERVQWRAVAAGVAVFALMFSLYAIGLLSQAETVEARVESFASSEARLSGEALQAALKLVTGEDYETARGLDAPIQDAARRHDLSQIFQQALNGFILVGGMIAALDVVRRTSRRDSALIVLIWFALPVLAMSYTGQPVHPFYQFLSVPAGGALAVWGLDTLRGRPRTGALGVMSVLLIPFGVLMLINHARYSQETLATPSTHGFYAFPVEHALTIGDIVNDSLPDGGRLYIRAEEWIANSYAGTLFPSSQDIRVPGFIALPQAGGLIITLTMDSPPLALGAERLQQIPLMDGSLITVDRLAPADDVHIGERLNVPSAEGLRLQEASLTQDGETVTLTTLWQVDSPPTVQTATWILQPYIHVFDADGNRIVNLSGEGLPAYAWQIGDVHVHQSTFPLPPETKYPVSIVTGQFDGAQGTGLTFLLPDGTTSGGVTLPMSIDAP